jgi:hypothetical protein
MRVTPKSKITELFQQNAPEHVPNMCHGRFGNARKYVRTAVRREHHHLPQPSQPVSSNLRMRPTPDGQSRTTNGTGPTVLDAMASGACPNRLSVRFRWESAHGQSVGTIWLVKACQRQRGFSHGMDLSGVRSASRASCPSTTSQHSAGSRARYRARRIRPVGYKPRLSSLVAHETIDRTMPISSPVLDGPA